MKVKNMSSITTFLENNNQDFLIEKSYVTETRSKSNFETEILIGGVEIIEKLSAEWIILCEEGASNDPFLRPEWFVTFVKNFEKEIKIITVRHGGKLRAVLPLVKKKNGLHGIPARKLQAVSNLNTQRFDLIHGADEAEREEIVKAVWKEIKNQAEWNVLEIRMVKKDSWLGDLLALAEKENYKTGIWQMDSAPFVILPQGDDKEKLIEDFSNGLSKNRRRLLKKKMRILEALGTVEFATTRGYQADLMQKYFELEAQSWKGRGGTAVTDDERVASLHDEFARKIAARNAFFIYELKLNGNTIAMRLSIMYDHKTIFWKTSFNENYARYSPGYLLFKEVLDDCIRQGSTEIDMLSPATHHKKIWASCEYEHAAFYIFQRGIVGTMLWRWKFSVISYLRKFKKSELKNEPNPS